MAVLLKRLLSSRLRAPVDERFAIGVERMEVDVTAAEVAELVRSARASDRSFQAARTRFRTRLAELVAARVADQSRQPVLASVAEVVTVVRKAQAYQRLCNRAWPRVAPEQLVQSLYKNRRRLEQAGSDLLSSDELRLLLAASPPPRPIDMSATDVALLDEARWLIEPELRTFGHVVIDEAQNLTPMELRMVVCRARQQSLTVLGDIAQRTTEAGLSSWENVLRDARVRDFATRELEISYRVPSDFLALASSVAGIDANVPEGVRLAPWLPVAVGAHPNSLGAIAIGLARAMEASAGSVALVAPDDWLPHVRAALAGIPFADGTTGPLSAGINLLDLRVVKGLEFDAVVVIDPQGILAQPLSGGRGALYTALTRSTRALAIVHAGGLPPGLASSALLTHLPGREPEAEWARHERDR